MCEISSHKTLYPTAFSELLRVSSEDSCSYPCTVHSVIGWLFYISEMVFMILNEVKLYFCVKK